MASCLFQTTPALSWWGEPGDKLKPLKMTYHRTYKYRVKDGAAHKELERMAGAVNLVWNYCNELSARRWEESRECLRWVDLDRLVVGAYKALGISRATISRVIRQHSRSRTQAKTSKLRWRSRKRSLGWIPFRDGAVAIKGDTVTYYGHTFKVWLSRPVEGEIRNGSFSCDSRGRWYVNLVCEIETDIQPAIGQPIGIDLGLKEQVVCSNGTVYARENLTRKHERRLAAMQRARKKRQVTALHAKIRNARKDWAHKVSAEIVKNSGQIFVGNVDSAKLMQTKMSKSVSDAGWYQFKTALAYKAIGLGVVYEEINESFSTVTCSSCRNRTGPSGLNGLGVREWGCSCGAHHNRDVNAAKNILAFGLGHQTPKGVLAARGRCQGGIIGGQIDNRIRA